MSIQELLRDADKNYNPEICLLGGEFNGPGYHTNIPNGTWTHSTRGSINYAVQLLKSGETELEKRAFDIIGKVVSLQETNPYSPNYGIWSWLYEEPLDKMSPPDFNWADFIGAALSHVAIEYHDRLPKELYDKVTAAIGHAAWAIFRRNVQPGYTNIAIMGVVVTAVAGELLGEKRLLEYAGIRLQTFIDYTLDQGGLNEYNSPTYTIVALHEVDRIIQLVKTPDIVANARRLHGIIWKCLAAYYHPGTGQLAGPHSRAYSDLLVPTAVKYIEWATGQTQAGETEPEAFEHVGRAQPCPAEYLERFIKLPAPEIERCDRFIKRKTPEKSFVGTVWMNGEAALGSINYECFWTQRRPLLGYWTDSAGQVAVLRLRMLKDGKDFSAGGLHNAQSGRKILTGIKMFTDRGDYHIHLDKPTDGTYRFNSLVLRYELTARDAALTENENGLYELSAGNWKAAIIAPPGKFNGCPVVWRSGRVDNTVYVEAVMYEGAAADLTLDESVCTEMAMVLELLGRDDLANPEFPVMTRDYDDVNVTWNGLSVKYNPCAEPYESV